MRVLVVGSEGFVGGHLLPALERAGHEAIGTTLDGSTGPRLELPDDASAERVLREVRPDAVVHLAAISAVPAVAAEPERAWRVNVDGVLSVHRAIRRGAPDACLLYISTGAVYGAALPGEGPADESRPCTPTNAYARSKLAAEAAIAMHESGPRCIVARPFNHVGPGQDDAFAIASFARQIAEAEREGGGRIRTGRLEGTRDFLDVRDVVGAYIALLEEERCAGIYNVCSGTPRRIGDLLDRLLDGAREPIEVVSDAARHRAVDPDPVTGSADRIRRETGWEPARALDETLAEILEDWRRRALTVGWTG